MNALKIVGIGGSLAAKSASLAALTVALDGARDYGAEIRLLDLRRLDLPMYVPSNPTVPDAARELCEAVQPAHGLIWSSPLYHGTVSGAFKNALDWLVASVEFPGKAVALLNTSARATHAQAQLTEILTTMSATLAPGACTTVSLPRRLSDAEAIAAIPEVAERLKQAIADLARLASRAATNSF